MHHQEFFHCTHSNGICHKGLLTAGTEVLILLASYQQTCMTYTIAVCTVKKLLMMDRGIVQNMESFIPKINEKLVQMVGFIRILHKFALM